MLRSAHLIPYASKFSAYASGFQLGALPFQYNSLFVLNACEIQKSIVYKYFYSCTTSIGCLTSMNEAPESNFSQWPPCRRIGTIQVINQKL